MMNNSATLSYLSELTSKDLFTLLGDLNGLFTGWAEKLNISTMILLIAGAVLAAVIGVFGYKLIKLTLAIFMGGFGYLAGCELFGLVIKNPEKLDWLVYVFGGVLAIVFLAISIARPRVSLFVLAAALGYAMVQFYAKGNAVLGIAGAIVLGFIAIRFARVVFCLLTSAVGGFALVSFLSALLPNVAVLQLKAGEWIGLAIGAGAVLVFFIIQMVSNKRKKYRI